MKSTILVLLISLSLVICLNKNKDDQTKVIIEKENQNKRGSHNSFLALSVQNRVEAEDTEEVDSDLESMKPKEIDISEQEDDEDVESAIKKIDEEEEIFLQSFERELKIR